MSWEVVATDDFEAWLLGLDEDEQADVDACVLLLEERGPTLEFPYSSGINGSKYDRMRELRIQHAGKPYRVLYIFDPKRRAVLLLGGIKTDDKKWYKKATHKADRLYSEYLEQEGQ